MRVEPADSGIRDRKPLVTHSLHKSLKAFCTLQVVRVKDAANCCMSLGKKILCKLAASGKIVVFYNRDLTEILIVIM